MKAYFTEKAHEKRYEFTCVTKNDIGRMYKVTK